MTIQSADLPEWTRRHFVRVGLISAGAAALGTDAPWRIASAFAATDPASDLDNLARSLRGRMLRGASPGYDEARKVWNLAYDRRPLAMVRAAHIDDVRHCVEFARKHSVPIAIRGRGHSYAGYGVADGALQIDLGAFTTVTVDRDGRSASVGGGTRIRDISRTGRASARLRRSAVRTAHGQRARILDQGFLTTQTTG